MIVLAIFCCNVLVAAMAAWSLGRFRVNWPVVRCAILAASAFPTTLIVIFQPLLISSIIRGQCGQEGCGIAIFAVATLLLFALLLLAGGIAIAFWTLRQTSHPVPYRRGYSPEP